MPRNVLPGGLVPLVSNNYWREPDAEQVLAVWAQSGLTLSAFARQCGLSVRRLTRWKKRLEASGGPRFHPVEVVGEQPVRGEATSDSGVELVHASGHRIAVRRDFDPHTLCQLLEVLEALGC
jgi:hypothetical protein